MARQRRAPWFLVSNWTGHVQWSILIATSQLFWADAPPKRSDGHDPSVPCPRSDYRDTQSRKRPASHLEEREARRGGWMWRTKGDREMMVNPMLEFHPQETPRAKRAIIMQPPRAFFFIFGVCLRWFRLWRGPMAPHVRDTTPKDGSMRTCKDRREHAHLGTFHIYCT